eukprot:GHVP01031192.1.p1 GENE.GHVP01031192.1~~GHVP01031192.1.p1  ORF type:complete len:481 (-),score=45.41 GHVP01031192.1:455-1726(-)
MAGREALLVSGSITSTDVSGTDLLTIPVDPTIVSAATVTNGTIFYPTPLAFVSTHFNAWRGSIRYKLQLVASQFHSGRLQVLYYPRSTSYNTDEPFELLSQIIDIERDTEFKFSIPYTEIVPYTSQKFGDLVIKVVNTLTFKEIPIPDIYYNLWISGGPDFEWHLPLRTIHYNRDVPVPFEGYQAPTRYVAQIATGSAEADSYPTLAPFDSPHRSLNLKSVTKADVLGKADLIRQVTAAADVYSGIISYPEGGFTQVINDSTVAPTSGNPFWSLYAYLSRFRRGGTIYIMNDKSTATPALDAVEPNYCSVTLTTQFQNLAFFLCGNLTTSTLPASEGYLNSYLAIKSSDLVLQPLSVRVPYYHFLNYTENIMNTGATVDNSSFITNRTRVTITAVRDFEISTAADTDMDFYFQIGPPQDFQNT